MKKLFIFLFCLIGLAASAQQATPVSPVQVPQATLYNEPSTGTRWWYNGATLGWYPVFPYSPPNTVLTGLSLSVVSSTLTVHTGTWRINNQVYTLASNTNFTLQARDSLYSRYETVYATGANNGIGIKVGILSPTPIQPSVGTDTLIVGAVLITPTQTTIIPPGPANEFVFSGPLVQQSYANPWVRTLRVDTIKVAGQYIMPSRHGTSGQFIQDDGNGNLFFSNAGTYLPGFGLHLTGQTFSADTNKLVTQTALLDTLRNNAAHFNPTQFTIVNDTISLIGGGGGNTIYTGDGTISDPLGRMVTISNSSILQFATPKLSGDSVYVGIDNTGFYAYRHSTNGGTSNLDDEIYAGIGNTALLSIDNTTGNNSQVTTSSGNGTNASIIAQDGGTGNLKEISMSPLADGSAIGVTDHLDGIGMKLTDTASYANGLTDSLSLPPLYIVKRLVTSGNYLPKVFPSNQIVSLHGHQLSVRDSTGGLDGLRVFSDGSVGVQAGYGQTAFPYSLSIFNPKSAGYFIAGNLVVDNSGQPITSDVLLAGDSSTNIAPTAWIKREIAAHSGTTYTAGTGLTLTGTVFKGDTSILQTVANFFPKGDTRYLKTSTASSTYALQSTTISAGTGLTGGGSLAANRTLNADTTVLRTVSNSYSLAGIQTKLNNYTLTTSFVDSETPTGSINSSNTSFTLANTPVSGSLKVYLNGLRLKLTTDYSLSGTTLTMVIAPTGGLHPDILLVDYRK